MLTSPASRGTALNFLSRRLPQLHGLEDITGIVGQDIGLMIRAFAAALEDDNLLVRRGALDLLLQSLRVDSNTIRKASAEDRSVIMRAAMSVVLRRDLSLNRRLYSWLLGPEERSDRQIEYFKTNAMVLLKDTLTVTELLFQESGLIHLWCRKKCLPRPMSIASPDHSKSSSPCWTNGRLDRP